MDVKALASAKAKLAETKNKLERVAHAKNVKELAEAWSDFLHKANATFTRVVIAADKTKNKDHMKWIRQKKRERDADELLNYLTGARHADEHGLDAIYKAKAGGIALNPANAQAPMILNNVSIGPAGVDLGASVNVKVDFIPEELELVPARARGVVYPLPTKHRGEDLSDKDPVTFAKLGVAYLEELISEADSR